MKLINGRGQLGEELKKRNIKSDWIIYHTWNFLDKNIVIQTNELSRFARFVDHNKDKKIMLISTKCNAINSYVQNKRKAELYLICNVERYKIVRLPNLLGKGICQKLKEESVRPYGTIELMTIFRACDKIESALQDIGSMYEIEGSKIPAELLYKIIQFGKK